MDRPFASRGRAIRRIAVETTMASFTHSNRFYELHERDEAAKNAQSAKAAIPVRRSPYAMAVETVDAFDDLRIWT